MFAKPGPTHRKVNARPGTLLSLLLLTTLGAAQAEDKAPEPVAQTEPVAPAKVTPARRSAGELKPVTITGAAVNETEDRRQSTASKIIVGRDEIADMTEVQKKLLRLLGRASFYAGAFALSCAGLAVVSFVVGVVARTCCWAFMLAWGHR